MTNLEISQALPWKYEADEMQTSAPEVGVVVDVHGYDVMCADKQRAEFIVLACNNFEPLKSTLSELLSWQNREFVHTEGCATEDVEDPEDDTECDCGYQDAVDRGYAMLAALNQK